MKATSTGAVVSTIVASLKIKRKMNVHCTVMIKPRLRSKPATPGNQVGSHSVANKLEVSVSNLPTLILTKAIHR